MRDAELVIFTKPAEPGRVKTRLIRKHKREGEPAISAVQAAELHRAFLEDLSRRLAAGSFDLRAAWALEPGEEPPPGPLAGFPQLGDDLGERLFNGLSKAAENHDLVGAVGSDHPELPLDVVEEAFERLRAGVDWVVGPSRDGGYYFIGARRESLQRAVFEGVSWSTSTVLEETLTRCERLSLAVELLEAGSDVDTPEDLLDLAARLGRSTRPGSSGAACPRTRDALRELGLLPRVELPA